MNNIDFSKIIKAFIYNLKLKNIKNSKIENIIYKASYKVYKKGFLKEIKPIIVFNGNGQYPYSQAVCDVLYEIRVCGQDISSDFSYVLKHINEKENFILNKLLENI